MVVLRRLCLYSVALQNGSRMATSLECFVLHSEGKEQAEVQLMHYTEYVSPRIPVLF